MVDPAAKVEGVAPHLETHGVPRPRDLAPDRIAQLQRAALIGIQAEDPLAAREIESKVLLGDEAFPGMVDHARRVLPRSFHGAIRAAGVDHDHLVAPRDTAQAFFDVIRFILADDRGGDTGRAVCRR